jgi:hypothetical protein
MRWARPSTMAVLPTPGSPISTGLFLVRRCSTWMARRISSSRPITGSSLPRRARSVRSMQYFFSASRWPSASALFTPLAAAHRVDGRFERLADRPLARARPPMSVLLSAKASRNISLAMNWSLRLMASFSVACSRATSVGPDLHLIVALHLRQHLTMAVPQRPARALTLTPARSSSALWGRRSGAAWPPAHGPARCRRCRCPGPAL